MRIATYITNWLIVCLFCFAGNSAMYPLYNRFVQYPSAGLERPPLPANSEFCLDNPWILWAVPLVWGIVTVFFLCLKNSTEKLMFHLSASILLGLFVFFMHAIGGIFPFIAMAVGGR